MALPLLLPAGVAAQAATSPGPAGQAAAGAPSGSELAKQPQNPIASLISSPLQGNWEADDEKWSSPLLFRVSKVTTLGKRPVNFTIAAGPTFGPDAGPDWRFRFAANFLFPR